MWINGLLCSVGVRNNVIIIVVDARYHQAPILQWAIEIQLCSKKGMCCCYWLQVTFFRRGSLWSRCYTQNSKLLGKKQVTFGLHVSQMPFNLPICHCLVGFLVAGFNPTFQAWNVSNQPVRFSSNPCSVLYFARKSRSQSIEGSSATSQGPTTILFCGVVSGRCQGSCKCPRKRHGANMCQWTHSGHEFQQPSPILELHPKCNDRLVPNFCCPCFLVQS